MSRGYVYLLAPVVGWVVAQSLKFIFVLRKDGLQWRDLYVSGGTPSSHTASIVALATTIGLAKGFTDPLFALAATVSVVIMYDAMGVRRTVGEQTGIIKQLMAGNKAIKKPRMHDARGHSPRQVAWGIVVGLASGLFLHVFFVS